MTGDIDLHIGKRLRRRRQLLGMTQQQLGSAIGVGFQQIQKYECAANALSAGRLFQLARVLGVDVQFFYNGYEPDRAPSYPAPQRPAESRSFAARSESQLGA
jgi:transcriptional regulator with XRE-family HTH domain